MTSQLALVDPRPEVSRRIRRTFAGRQVRVLDAGCGPLTHLELPEDWLVAGLDTSREQLQRNARLNERIVADLQDVQLSPAFDLAICWNVLEHLSNPRAALRNMVNALKPGGILVIAVPLLDSLKGQAAKLTPHWFHVAFFRWALGRPDAGKPGRPPFTTYMRADIAPRRLREFLNTIGARETYRCCFLTDYYHQMLTERGVLSWALRKAAAAIKLLSSGRIPWECSDFVAVYEKTAS